MSQYIGYEETPTTRLPNGAIVYHCEQRSREWIRLRVGKPTASRFGSIITPVNLKPSKGRFNLIAELLAERRVDGLVDWNEIDDQLISGVDSHGNAWTKRGSELEDDARRWYALHKGVQVEEIGFVTDADGEIGCSPDGMTADGRVGVEIKCRNATNHLRMVLGYDEIASRTQTQGTLYVTGWEAVDAVAFNPDLPKRIVRHYPNPRFFQAFREALAVLHKDMDTAEAMLAAVEEDVVEDDNLKAMLTASIQKPTKNDQALDIDELETLREDMDRAESLGLWGVDDRLGVIRDIEADDWESVRGMRTYLTRLLEQEATPA